MRRCPIRLYFPLAGRSLLQPIPDFDAYTGRVGLIIASAAGQADWAVPDGFAACLMVGLGLSAGIGHYLRIMAFQHIDPAANALFFYAQRVWAMLFGVAFFGELPDALSLASMLIIVGSGLFVALLR